MFSLSNIKNAGVRDTPIFQAMVTEDGRKIAIVGNGGSGGCCDWQWIDYGAKKRFEDFIDGIVLKKFGADADVFEQDDAWVYGEIDRLAMLKMCKRKSRTHTIVRTGYATKGEDSIYTIKGIGPAVVAYVNRKWSDAEIYDPATERFSKAA